MCWHYKIPELQQFQYLDVPPLSMSPDLAKSCIPIRGVATWHLLLIACGSISGLYLNACIDSPDSMQPYIAAIHVQSWGSSEYPFYLAGACVY